MVFESSGHTESQGKLPQLSFQVKIQPQNHKKHCKNIILAENELTENPHWKYKKSKLAEKRFFLPEAKFHTNPVQ